MEIKINKTFTTRHGIPLTLINTNNQIPDVLCRQLTQKGLQHYELFAFYDNVKYRHINFLWQAMMQAEPNDIRRYFKTDYPVCMNNFISPHPDTNEKLDWDSMYPNIKQVIMMEVSDMLDDGIKVVIDGQDVVIDNYLGAIHFVGMEWFKQAYIKCYNEDNGIKEGCFITTAVCNNFGKSDDCYELNSFRRFRDTWLIHQQDGADLIHEYYADAPSIVSCINQRADAGKVYREIWDKYLSVCLKYIEENQMSKCKDTYVNMVRVLKRTFIDNGNENDNQKIFHMDGR